MERRPFLFLRSLPRCVLGPWPKAFLSLASRGSVLGRAVLGRGFFCLLDSTFIQYKFSLFSVTITSILSSEFFNHHNLRCTKFDDSSRPTHIRNVPHQCWQWHTAAYCTYFLMHQIQGSFNFITVSIRGCTNRVTPQITEVVSTNKNRDQLPLVFKTCSLQKVDYYVIMQS